MGVSQEGYSSLSSLRILARASWSPRQEAVWARRRWAWRGRSESSFAR